MTSPSIAGERAPPAQIHNLNYIKLSYNSRQHTAPMCNCGVGDIERLQVDVWDTPRAPSSMLGSAASQIDAFEATSACAFATTFQHLVFRHAQAADGELRHGVNHAFVGDFLTQAHPITVQGG